MKKLILSMVFVFTTLTMVSAKENLEMKIFHKGIKSTEMSNEAVLCATVAYHAANAAEKASGRTFTFEEWKFYYDLNNAACLASNQ